MNHFNSIESREVLRQSIYTTSSLLGATTPLIISDPKKAFNFRFLRFQPGQWIDVKDTIDQWLEAQVTKIRPNQVYIHYNGWGSQWDEWIPTDSPRIAPFRTHTLQYPTSRYQCPSPNISPDSDNNEIPEYDLSFDPLLAQSMSIMDRVRNLMNVYINLDLGAPEEFKNEAAYMAINRKRKQHLAAQLAPLLDRTGKILSEFSNHFAHEADPIHFKDDLEDLSNENQEDLENDDPDPLSHFQVPLISNPGDVSLVTNLLDRVLFGDSPTLELHIHSDQQIHQNLQNPLTNELSDPVSEYDSMEPMPPESVEVQTSFHDSQYVQTDFVEFQDSSVNTQERETIGIQTNTRFAQQIEEEKKKQKHGHHNSGILVSKNQIIPQQTRIEINRTPGIYSARQFVRATASSFVPNVIPVSTPQIIISPTQNGSSIELKKEKKETKLECNKK